MSNFDSQEDIAYPNDPRVPIKVDDDLKQLFREIELPRDMLDIEKDLAKTGMKPATNTAQRRAAAQVQGISTKAKPKKKKHEISKRTKLTNAHLPELFQNLNGSWNSRLYQDIVGLPIQREPYFDLDIVHLYQSCVNVDKDLLR